MDGTVSLKTNIAFLQQQVKRVAGEGSTVTRFKAVVCADHVLVAFCFTADSSSAALGNLHTENNILRVSSILCCVFLSGWNLFKEIVCHFRSTHKPGIWRPRSLQSLNLVLLHLWNGRSQCQQIHDTICACLLSRAQGARAPQGRTEADLGGEQNWTAEKQ